MLPAWTAITVNALPFSIQAQIDLTLWFLRPCQDKLWKVVKMFLVLSHWQTLVVEHNTMNKQVETDNLYEQSVAAKRTICYYVGCVGGIKSVDVTSKKLIPVNEQYHFHGWYSIPDTYTTYVRYWYPIPKEKAQLIPSRCSIISDGHLAAKL